MAFKMTQKPTFTTPVSVNVPNEKGGFDKNTFVAKFKRVSQDEAQELRELSLMPDELVRRVLVDWDLKDSETNEAVPFNSENLNALLQILPTPLATAVAFWETVNGARTKN
jgi:hypothetical protein